MPSPCPEARLRTTSSATWLASTKPIVHPESVNSRLTAGWRHSNVGLKRSPAATAAGTTTNAIDAMPTVAPSPRVQRSRSSVSTSSSVHSVDPAPGSDSSVTMMTRLGRIGLQAAARKRRRLLRYALASPVRP